jgi:predicted small lipoprotein YifL
MRNSIRAICAAATVLAVAGCGGSGYKSQPAPMDGPPSLSVIGDQSIDQDSPTAPIPFSVDDRETAAGSLAVTVTSSDTGIVAADGLVLGGDGASRTLTITPVEAAFGTASITLSAKDGAGQSVSRTFGVTVKPVFVSFTKFTSDTYATDENADVRPLKGFTLDTDADENPGAFDSLF